MPAARAFFHFVCYIGFRLGEGIVRLLPLDLVFVLGRAGGELAYRILWRRRSLALNNLRLAFGREKSEEELRALNREHFRLLGANLSSALKVSTLPNDKIWERVIAHPQKDRPAIGWIALVSHMGNWELYHHLIDEFPEYRFGAVYQPLANPFIDRRYREARKRSGITLFDRRTDLLACARFLREGGVVGVLSDQGAGYAGLWTPLFGRLTSTSTLVARLALRTGVAILPITVRTCGRARWHITAEQPIFPDTEDPEFLTAQLNRVLEKQIRTSPADWLWAHNRWKPLRPHFLFARDRFDVFFPPDFDRGTLDPFRILLISPATEELARATFPAVEGIKQGRPDAHLTVLTPLDLTTLWRTNPSLDAVLPSNAISRVHALAAHIARSARFDAAVFFAADSTTARAVREAGVPLRVCHRSEPGAAFCNQHPPEPERALDPLALNLHLARSVGAEVKVPSAA